MEVPVLKTRRRSLQFDSLEGKVLLSATVADPAATVHRSTAAPFVLNGSMQGLPTGSFVAKGLKVTTFPVSGHLGSMGKVSGLFLLSDKLVTRGTLPNLTNSFLVLTDQTGSMLLGIRPLGGHRYSFQIVGVTTNYISASGSGFLTIAPSPTTSNLIITFHSTRT
jgi:hypothetical protein